MFLGSRRAFLGAALAGLASGQILGADEPAESITQFFDDPPFQPSTLFLTWQRDPTTTMTVQWIGAAGETADTNVSYSGAQDDRWLTQTTIARPYPKTDLKVFRAELTGLSPGTDYEFRVGKLSPTYRFRTMPAKATNTIHFLSGGDCGFNAHTVANNIQAARQDPMFAVIGGDLGYDNGRLVEVSLAFLRNYSKHMIGRDGRLIPLVACLGNHEVDGGYNKSRAKAPFFYALFDGLYPETGFTTLDFGDYLSLVLLDTGHTSPIAGAQADWLEKTLRARAEHPNVFVVNHVPAYPSYRKMEGAKGKEGTGEGNRKHWVPLFEKYRVPVVLEHHDHTFKRTKPLLDGLGHPNGVLYLGDGSWGQLRSPQSPEKLSHLARSSRDYHLSLHCLQGQERFHLALDEYGRVMDVCRTGQRKTGTVLVPT
jgi:purple acid phosphatase-like protein/calcineurin-like phosphoesterase family protein